MNAPDRRQRRSAETRERLFRAALRLFAEKGFAETTVEDITNAADVGKGTFFNYFPSKEHILIAFSDMQLSKLQATVDQMRDAARAHALILSVDDASHDRGAFEVTRRRARPFAGEPFQFVGAERDAGAECSSGRIAYAIGADRAGARRVSAGRACAGTGTGLSADHLRDVADVVASRRRLAAESHRAGAGRFCGWGLHRARQ